MGDLEVGKEGGRMNKYCDVCMGAPRCPCCGPDMEVYEACGFRLDDDGFTVIDNDLAEDAMANDESLPYKEYCYDVGLECLSINHSDHDIYSDLTNELGCAHAFADWMTKHGADWIIKPDNLA